jgi:hypothetical protein
MSCSRKRHDSSVDGGRECDGSRRIYSVVLLGGLERGEGDPRAIRHGVDLQLFDFLLFFVLFAFNHLLTALYSVPRSVDVVLRLVLLSCLARLTVGRAVLSETDLHSHILDTCAVISLFHLFQQIRLLLLCLGMLLVPRSERLDRLSHRCSVYARHIVATRAASILGRALHHRHRPLRHPRR